MRFDRMCKTQYKYQGSLYSCVSNEEDPEDLTLRNKQWTHAQ